MRSGKSILILILGLFIISAVTACGSSQEPALSAELNGQNYDIPGRADSVSEMSWTGRTTVREVSWAESLETVYMLTADESSELTLTFSEIPDTLQVQLTGADGTVQLLDIAPAAVCTVSVSAGASLQITGTWTVGSTVYTIEFSEIHVTLQ